VNPALTRFSAKLRAEGKSQLAANMLKSGFLFKLVTGIAMSAICLIFSDAFATHILNRPGMGFLIKLTSLLIIFQTVFTTSNSSFIGLDKMEGNALIMNVQAIVKTAISPLLVILGFSVVGALAGHITSYMIAGLAGSLLLLKYYKSLGKPPSGNLSSSLKVMLGYGFPLYASALLGLFLGQYQTIILAFFASNAEIGNFNITVVLSSLINVLIFPLGALFPAFSKVNPNSSELRRIFKLSAKYAALLIIPATVILTILSKEIVYTLYGYSYGLAPFFLQLYILTFFFSGLGSVVLGYLFNGIGETRIAFKCSLINLFVFLPLAPALTSLYHVPGLIIASVISGLLSLAFGLFVAIKKIHVSLDLKASLKIYLASFLSAIPTLLFLQLSPLNNLSNLIMGGSLFLLTYLTLTPITGAIHQPDLDNFKLMFSNLKILWPLLKPVLAYEAKLLSIL